MAAFRIKRSSNRDDDEIAQSKRTRRFLPARKGQGRYLLWRNSTILFLLIALYMLFSIQRHFNDLAERAIAEGKRVVVDVKTGEMAGRELPSTENDTLSSPMDAGGGDENLSADAPVETGDQPAVVTSAEDASDAVNLDIGAADFEPPELPALLPNRFTHDMTIIIRGLGLNKAVTERAIALPAEVHLAFSPYTVDLATTIAKAQEAGHNILLDVPASTEAFPYADAGPLALMMDALQEQNLYRLQTMLKQANYAAILFPQRDTVTTSSLASIPILDFLNREDVLLIYQENSNNDYLAAQAKSINHAHINRYLVLDEIATREHVYDAMIGLRERINADQGNLTLVAGPYPLSIKLVEGLLNDFAQAGYSPATIEEMAE